MGYSPVYPPDIDRPMGQTRRNQHYRRLVEDILFTLLTQHNRHFSSQIKDIGIIRPFKYQQLIVGMNDHAIHGMECSRFFYETVGEMGVETLQVFALHPDARFGIETGRTGLDLHCFDQIGVFFFSHF